jgi:hypothetical protein
MASLFYFLARLFGVPSSGASSSSSQWVSPSFAGSGAPGNSTHFPILCSHSWNFRAMAPILSTVSFPRLRTFAEWIRCLPFKPPKLLSTLVQLWWVFSLIYHFNTGNNPFAGPSLPFWHNAMVDSQNGMVI